MQNFIKPMRRQQPESVMDFLRAEDANCSDSQTNGGPKNSEPPHEPIQESV
ncbi:hypothetical protein QM996_15025 [Sinorhizobium chiapasense]